VLVLGDEALEELDFGFGILGNAFEVIDLALEDRDFCFGC
jgi:hypothetical protein